MSQGQKREIREGERRTMLTFRQAAERLVAEGHVRNMTPEGLRKLARTDPEWPIDRKSVV